MRHHGECSLSSVSKVHAEGPLILALDIGTSSVRSLIFDRLGRLVNELEIRRPLAVQTSRDGAAEMNARQLLNTLFDCLDGILERAGSLGHLIAGVATCTLVGNILGLDDSAEALTPLFTYADTRAAADAAQLRKELKGMDLYDRTGCPIHSSYLPARLRWLNRTQPDLFHRVSRWVSIGEYLELKLFGETAVSYSVASWSGLLDRRRLVWESQLLERLSVSKEKFSPLTDVDTPRLGLLPHFSSRWPVLRNVPWFPALGDGAAANIGSGCNSPSRVAVTVGTSSAVRAALPDFAGRFPDGLWCYRVDKKRSLAGGAMNEGGSVYAWMNSTLKLADTSKLEMMLNKMEPDAHGLTILPFLSGERSPGWAGQARATLHGLSMATTSLDILRAGLEAVAYRIAVVLDLLCTLVPSGPELVATGGALLCSPTWIQIIADVTGQPVVVSHVKEASARGVALLALEAIGVIEDVSEAPDFIGRSHVPHFDHHARYREALERQRDLYEKLVTRSV